MRTLPLLLWAVLIALPVQALEPVNRDASGVAARGYDVVAYFDAGKPTLGSADHVVEWQGAVWRFASAESKQRFVESPAAFAPQYGGYCAYAVSRNYTADADPLAWTIVEGKLYLNYNLPTRAEWEKEIPRNIRRGDANWPSLLAGRKSRRGSGSLGGVL